MIRRIALIAPFVCAAVLSLSAQGPAGGAATVLPIRRVVLYKIGVGDSSAERRLLDRYAGHLEAQETRLDTLKRELATMTERVGRLQADLSDAIAAVSLDLAF